MSEQEIMERVEAYLSGRLGLEETARLEADLLEGGEVARMLSEELMLRELLGSMPPDAPPEGLTARIEGALPLGEAPPMPSALADQQPGRARSVLAQLGLALDGASWSLRGPAMALGPAGNNTGGRATLEGMSTARYALGPLADNLPRRSAPKKKKPLWRRAVAFGLKRRKR